MQMMILCALQAYNMRRNKKKKGPRGYSSIGFEGGKLIQGFRIESRQLQYENFNSNEGWFSVGTRSMSATLTGH